MSVQVPESITDEELGQWMLRTVGARIARVLGWETLASVTDIIIDALVAYGVDTVAQVDDVPRLKALARVELWRAVVEQTSGETYLAMPDGIRAYGHQINQQAVRALAVAERAAAIYGEAYVVTRVTIDGRRRRRNQW